MQSLGVTLPQVKEQIQNFTDGFPWLKIEAAATVGHGILQLTPQQQAHYVDVWKEFQRQSGVLIEKFQPASGAASRMFKNLFAFINEGKTEPETDFEKTFFGRIRLFAFYPMLNAACIELYKLDVMELIEAKRYADVLKALLMPEGMNYGSLPKALLKFHRAAGGTVHTPLEEHLEEGAQYAMDKKKRVRVHFTVSPEHREAFEKLLEERVPVMEKVWGVNYKVTLSEQKTSTNTIAVTMDNEPYRDAEGRLVFRPGGHGALIENLNERNADVIFIKNVDNVVPLRLRSTTTHYKKVLGGLLVSLQQQVSKYLRKLDALDYSPEELQRILKWANKALCISNPATATMDDPTLAYWLTKKLDRPIRVCGVVRNEGEPGGGPYLAYSADGTCAPQILESAQINPDDPDAVSMMKNGTHFNPVDLVCYIKNYKNVKFDLRKFVDPQTGFISSKSKDGVEFKALELPGLWNGSMSNWNTVFVEVPIETFNPVKTVNDLLRPSHQQ